MNSISTCRIEGCQSKIAYAGKRLCSKHYHRLWRNGNYEGRQLLPRRVGSNGYATVIAHGHPLAQHNGAVYEHRKVIHDIYGDNLPPCEICGAPSDWGSRKTHIDHRDTNRLNNDPKNLRVLCNPCNTQRNRKAPHLWTWCTPIEHEGITLTAAEWARDPRVNVVGATILCRIRKGASVEQALFGPKKTHNGRKR